MKNKVITRLAPSPTGSLHIGTVRTGLFNYLFAKQNEGKYILRIDDTDKERSTKGFEREILEHLGKMGLGGDETYHQSERLPIYRKYLKELLDKDLAYISQEKEISEGQSPEVIRFRNPNKTVHFQDLIRGEISIETTDLGDFIIAKDLDTPLYHFASIIDDFEFSVTHIIRGEDHISNTPRQILMWEAIDAPLPIFAHLPLILAPDRSKLSKRKHGEFASIDALINQGYLYEAIVNYVALLGWNPGTDQEIFSLTELVQQFDLTKIQKGGAIFNLEKLNWLNREYLKKLPATELKTEVERRLPPSLIKETSYNDKLLTKLLPLIQERIDKFSDITVMFEKGELDYFFTQPLVTSELLKTNEFLPPIIAKLKEIPEEDFTAEKIKKEIWDFATEKGRGKVLWPMRVALTGQEKSPDPFTVASLLGKAETLARLEHAQNL